jgi:archaellum component FlaC
VKDFLAEFDFSKALRDVREFSEGASKALADLSDQADKLATAYKLVKGAVEIIPNALNSAANAAGGAAAKIGAAVNAPLEAIGITAADTSRKLDSLGNDAFANVQEDANSFGDTLRLLGTTLFGIGDTAKEAGNKTDAAGAGFDRLGASAKGAGDKAAEAGEKIAGAGNSIATIPKSVEKVANSVDELEKQLSAMQQQFDLAKSIGASPEKLAELQKGIDDTRKKLKDLADASAALNKPLVETPQDGARAFEALGSAAGSAADDIEATGEAAQQSATMAAEGTASLSGVVAALFSKYSSLSEAAGRFFAETLKAANFGSLSLQSYGRAIEAADRATQQAFDNQVAGAGSAIAALEQFAQTGEVAGDATATAFYRSEQSLDAMSVAIQQGVGGFELLDSQTLSRLQGAIDAARQKTRQLSDDARAAAAELAAIGDQLEDQALRDSGNEAEIARRELERRIKNIEEIEKRAGAAGAEGAERAKRLAREEYERKIQDIQNAQAAQMQADKAAADARIAENQRVWDADPYNPNSTAQTATTAGQTGRSTGAIGTSRQRGQVPAEGINVQFNFDKGASIFTSQRQAEEVARLMLRELERLQRRKR